MITFNADEIYQIAEQMERNGAKFYRKAADGASDATCKQVLTKLADMEQDHERTFAAMRADLAGTEKAPTTFDPDNEGALYLQAAADGKVFDYNADPSERLSGSEPLDDILTTAIGLEKDSIVFYLSMKKMVPDARGKGRIDAIIEQEMGHVIILNEQLVALA